MSHEPSDIITPKALLLDERLTPLERNAWLTFRALAGSDGTVVLSYDALRGYLPSALGSKRAALETVSRAVLCLRLSTWIALVEYRRNPMTGLSMASRYNFPTKQHWRGDSKIEWITDGLQDLRRFLIENKVKSIAIPPLGAGNGGLDWAEVRSQIEEALAGLDTEILVCPPCVRDCAIGAVAQARRRARTGCLMTER